MMMETLFGILHGINHELGSIRLLLEELVDGKTVQADVFDTTRDKIYAMMEDERVPVYTVHFLRKVLKRLNSGLGPTESDVQQIERQYREYIEN